MAFFKWETFVVIFRHWKWDFSYQILTWKIIQYHLKDLYWKCLKISKCWQRLGICAQGVAALSGETGAAPVFLIRNRGVAGPCGGGHCPVSPINRTWRENSKVLLTEEESTIPKPRRKWSYCRYGDRAWKPGHMHRIRIWFSLVQWHLIYWMMF